MVACTATGSLNLPVLGEALLCGGVVLEFEHGFRDEFPAVGEKLSEHMQQRVAQVCGDLIQQYLDLFIVLLAEQGAKDEVQRAKIDQLVRCLNAVQLEPTLFIQGRRVPLVLEEGIPPVIKLNAEMFAAAPNHQLKFSFAKPIAQILGLPIASVGLVLQGEDEHQLRNLYHSARSGLQIQPILSNSVRAVIEHRVTMFLHRLRGLVFNLSGGARPSLPSPSSLIGLLSSRGAWPEWTEIATESFAKSAVVAIEGLLGTHPHIPPASVLIELCWESLDLSVQSFMRHVGRALRAQEFPVKESLMVAIAEVLAPDQALELHDLDHWPSLGHVRTAWEQLFYSEVEALGNHYHGVKVPPKISALRAPKDSMAIREPESLPFDHPLVCWSTREVKALGDMLQGFARSLTLNEESEFELEWIEPTRDKMEPAMTLPVSRRHVEMQVIGTDIDPGVDYAFLQRRAWESANARIQMQFAMLDTASQAQILLILRGTYDGFFINSKSVWERRLNGWKQDTPLEAFRRMTQLAREILGCDAIVDPFESPRDSTRCMIPTFCFIVAVPDQVERVPFVVPISSLIMTTSTGSPPLRMRFVHVPSVQNSGDPCSWACDRPLTMETMQGHPVQLTMRAVSSNMLRMLAYE